MLIQWLEQHQEVRGWLAVFGGFLVHLSLGTIYTIGNMSPYFTSYVRAYSTPATLDYAAATWVFAAALIGQGSSMFLGGALMAKLGPRWTTLLGGLCMSCGMFLSYFTIKLNYYAFLLTYGLIFGAGVGVAYAPPLACAMKWLPRHKGLVNGIVVAGFGGGAFIFNQVQTAYINPNNKAPNLPAFPGSSEMYFSHERAEDVLTKVPSCCLVLGACYVLLQVTGSMLLADPPLTPDLDSATHLEYAALLEHEVEPHEELGAPEQAAEKEEQMEVGAESRDVHPLMVIRTRGFWTLWLIFLVNGQSVTFISSLYKAYGQTFINDDRFLALVGSFSSVFNAVGRICWGRLVDKVPFKVCMLCLCTSMLVWMLTLIATPYGGKPMLFVWICAIFATLSGNFALLPTATARAFGQKYVAVNYGLVFTSQVVTGPLGAFLATSLLSTLHWSGMFALISAFTFIGWLLAASFNVKNQQGRNI